MGPCGEQESRYVNCEITFERVETFPEECLHELWWILQISEMVDEKSRNDIWDRNMRILKA